MLAGDTVGAALRAASTGFAAGAGGGAGGAGLAACWAAGSAGGCACAQPTSSATTATFAVRIRPPSLGGNSQGIGLRKDRLSSNDLGGGYREKARRRNISCPLRHRRQEF